MKKYKNREKMYCEKCEHCGFIECCGITDWLKEHIEGKTDCDKEAEVLRDIITLINLSLTKKMQQRYLIECPKCKSDKCSGWHEIVLLKTPKNVKVIKN